MNVTYCDKCGSSDKPHRRFWYTDGYEKLGGIHTIAGPWDVCKLCVPKLEKEMKELFGFTR